VALDGQDALPDIRRYIVADPEVDRVHGSVLGPQVSISAHGPFGWRPRLRAVETRPIHACLKTLVTEEPLGLYADHDEPSGPDLADPFVKQLGPETHPLFAAEDLVAPLESVL